MDFEDLPLEDIEQFLLSHHKVNPEDPQAAYDAAFNLLMETETDIPESILDWYNMTYYDIEENEYYEDIPEADQIFDINRLAMLPEEVSRLILKKLNCRDLLTMGKSSPIINNILKTSDVVRYGIINTGYLYNLDDVPINRVNTLCRILPHPQPGKVYINYKDGGISRRVNDVLYIDISANRNHYLLLDSTGSVYSHGSNRFGETGFDHTRYFNLDEIMKIPTLSNIISMSAGYDYSLFVDAKGIVYGCGTNRSGQLGLGNFNDQDPMVKNEYISDIISVSAGQNHSLFLSAKGQVYGTGSNIFHQLGIDKDSTSVPVLIPHLPKIIAVEAGSDHSLFLTHDGYVYACGNNSYGKLGWENRHKITVPRQIPHLSNIVFISSKDSHSLFVTRTGEVYGCGNNSHLELGIKGLGEISVPTLIPLPKLHKIIKVFTGENNSFFLTSDRQCYACGSRYDKNDSLRLIPELFNTMVIYDTPRYTLFLKKQ